jgi:hypothetical protein
MWVIIKNKKKEALRETMENIYALPNLSIKEVGASIPLDALALMEEFEFKPKGCFSRCSHEIQWTRRDYK